METRTITIGCIINGKAQHDWGEWGEWHYHRYPTHRNYRRRSRLIAGIGYKQRIRVCKRCRATDVERAEIYV